MANPMLALMQFCDSNFPNGSFSQSFGLETYLQKNAVHDAPSFKKWLSIYLHEQLVHADGLGAKLIYEALEQQDVDKVRALSHQLIVQSLARETREGTQRIGENILTIAAEIYDIELLKFLQKEVKAKRCRIHMATVFAIIAYELGIDKSTMLLYFLYSSVVGIIQNAVRAIPLGQTSGQLILHEFQTEIEKATQRIMSLDEFEFGVVSIGLELSQMQHERIGVRIFSS